MFKKMFGIGKSVKEEVKKPISDLEYVVENTCDSIEEILHLNKLNVKFNSVKVTVNSIKMFYELYVSVNEKDEVGFTKMKQIYSLSTDLERINKFMKVKTENQMVVFQIPRPDRQCIRHDELFNKIGIQELKNEYTLPMIIGVDEDNRIRVEDLVEKPHIFIAGTTGSGKSVSFNGLICTWLKIFDPDDIQFAFIDPKGGIELGFYEDLDNYLFDSIKVLGDESIKLIYDVYDEMMERNKILKANKCKKIEQLHSLGIKMPRLIVGVDEYANVTTSLNDKKSKDEFEKIMSSILQMGRAAGVHCLLCTQRPTVDVMSGGIKANVIFRLGFQLATGIDSKTVIDQNGLETLLGNGDGIMFDSGKLTSFQSPFISEFEIERIVKDAKKKKVEVETEAEVENEENIQ